MLRAFTDGAARGRNGQGPAASAWVIFDETGKVVISAASTIGVATNNEAEYRALLFLLKYAANTGIKELAIHSDSELMVKQITGLYAVKNAKIFGFWQEARDLLSELKDWTLTWVPRAENSVADALCNKVLDENKS